ncbi:hypothetical protein MIN45_P0683 [Methylomarinovum tepidoasis]|uniref:YfdX protein n=1 Tax=Methylomarinovum tepidoasis TaxID=2840183 RepID=A0AAU9D032_9GAMM|nr:YfdX family protein [Methylomarinovum sp. IN45]BCX88314.1 hypothetical protein MIN45_P0683 [Methylomarinovum sp. IN45]
MRLKTFWHLAGLFLLLIVTAPAQAAGKDHQATRQEVQPQVRAEQQKAISRGEDAVVKEAAEAVLATRAALAALEAGRTEEALAHLEIANGKLALLIARRPELGLIPVDSEAIIIDFKGDLKAIKKIVDEAEDLLDDGKVQDARALLTPLASEIRITTTNLPLALYPEIIKKVAPLIDQGKVKEAKETLIEALNTLVITESVIPIPVLRAEAMLRKADELAHAKQPQEDEILRYLENAKYQLRVAQALGYGDIDKDYKPLYKQIEDLEKQVKRQKWGERLNQMMAKLRKAVGGFRTEVSKPHKAE